MSTKGNRRRITNRASFAPVPVPNPQLLTPNDNPIPAHISSTSNFTSTPPTSEQVETHVQTAPYIALTYQVMQLHNTQQASEHAQTIPEIFTQVDNLLILPSWHFHPNTSQAQPLITPTQYFETSNSNPHQQHDNQPHTSISCTPHSTQHPPAQHHYPDTTSLRVNLSICSGLRTSRLDPLYNPGELSYPTEPVDWDHDLAAIGAQF